MKLLRETQTERTKLSVLLKDRYLSVPVRNRDYHSKPGRQRQLCQDLWETTGIAGEAREHFLNMILLLGEQEDKVTQQRRFQVLDAGSRTVGALVIVSAVLQIHKTVGKESVLETTEAERLLAAPAKLNNETTRRLHPKLRLQDSLDTHFQKWVTERNTSEVLQSLQDRRQHSAAAQVLLSSLEDSLNFFSEKLVAHESMQHMHAHFLDAGGRVTFQTLHTYCQDHSTAQAELSAAAEAVLEEFLATAFDRTIMIEMVVYDQETAWQLEKTLNSPNEPQSGMDRLRTALFSRYGTSGDSREQLAFTSTKWFKLQDLLAKQNPEAFWNCIVKMVQYHAVKQSTATAAQLLTDDDTLNYLANDLKLPGHRSSRALYTLMMPMHSDDEDSPAHAIALYFLEVWLEPFVHSYVCVASDNDDARKNLLPTFVRSMPEKSRNKLCRIFSYLGKQHTDFSSAGKWAEWVVPAIAFLLRVGQQRASDAATQHVTAFFEQLCRLAAYWQFCTTDSGHFSKRRAVAHKVARLVLDAGDADPSAEQLAAWTLDKQQEETFARKVFVLAHDPADCNYENGGDAMRCRQMLMLRSIELAEDKNSNLDRFPADTLEHVAPQDLALWTDWDPAKDGEVVYQLGNLLPLDRSSNAAAKHRPWPEKLPIYRNSSGTFLKQEFVDQHGSKNSWTPAMVVSRTKHLYRRVQAAWSLSKLRQVSQQGDFTEQEGQLEQTQVQSEHAAQTIVAGISGSTPNAAQSARQSGAASGTSNPEAVAGVGTSCPLPITPQLTLEEANQYAKLYLPYALGVGVEVTNLGHVVNKPGYRYKKSYIYPVAFTSTKTWKTLVFEQEIMEGPNDAPIFRVSVRGTDVQVEEPALLLAYKSAIAASGLPIPKTLLTSRSVTSAHEWWGLACGEDSNITKCLELLPNASDLLCSGLKFFKEGSRKPAGVRVANEVIPRANQLVWPDWYQQDMLAGRALVSTWRSQEPRGSGTTPLKRSRASKINDGFKRHKGRHSDCPAGAQDPITEAEYEGYKQKLKAELVARGHAQQAATEIVSSLDFRKSTRRPGPPHTIMWYMKASGHKKKLRSIEDVAKLYQAGTQGV